MTISRWTISILACLGLAACGKSEPAPSNEPAPPSTRTTTVAPSAHADQDKGAELFSQRCVACHGDQGRGDGAAAASLDPKPRNFHDTAWQQTVTDEQLRQVIQYGGAAVGKSPVMPAQPDLKDPALLASLVAHLRELGTTP